MLDGYFRHAGARNAASYLTTLTLAGTLAVAVPCAAHGAVSPAGLATATHNGSTLSQAEASARAGSTGKGVAVPAMTTPTSTLTAEPNGSFTLTQSLAPVRKRVGGVWHGLDATLVHNVDATLSPRMSTGSLRLSGGGNGPLATMTSTTGAGLSLDLPTAISALPTPTLNGNSALYPNVLPGVDLSVTADEQGGFSEVLIVHNAAAAANPALKALTFPVTSTGVNISADAAGNIRALDKAGFVPFNAPVPTMWDSAPASATTPTATDPTTGTRVDARTGTPLSSNAAHAGAGAHTASLKAGYRGGAITLTPDMGLMTGPGHVFPVYIDPSYTDNPTDGSNYTYVSSMYSTAENWDVTTTAAQGPLHVGYIDDTTDSPNYISTDRTYVRLPFDSVLHGATIQDSTLSFSENWSYSCTASQVDLYTTGVISQSTSWSTQPAQSSWAFQTSATTAHGYSSSCPTAAVGFVVKPLIQVDASAATSPTSLTFMLKAHDETTQAGWKQFGKTATLTTHYNRPPNAPGSLRTSGASTCSTGGTAVGKGDITVNASVSDPDGGTLYAYFKLWNTTTGTTVATTSGQAAISGTTTSMTVLQATMTADSGTTSTANYAWNVYVKDGTAGDTNALTSGASATCYFTYDPTSPGQPTVRDANGAECASTSTVPYKIGATATFTVEPNGSTTPTNYLYQLNGAAPISTTSTTITLKPTRRTDALTVTAQSAGGNLGTPGTCIFNAAAADPAADKDLTGDGIPDLLTVGGPGTSLASGIWAATGATSGQSSANPVDLGANGVSSDTQPSYFDGTQAITGRFTDNNVQDILDYSPTTGAGVILNSNGDGSIVQSQDSNNEEPIDSSQLDDAKGLSPLQLQNAYNADTSNSTSNATYPDLIGTAGNATTGYYLDYYESQNATGTWLSIDSNGDVGHARTIAHATPDGSDWSAWRIATAQIASSIDMILWKPSSGALYLWSALAVTDDANTLTATLAYTTQYTLDDGSTAATQWNKNASLSTLQVADINDDTVPDIWTVDTTGATAATMITSLSTTPNSSTVKLVAGSHLNTATHSWTLGDGSGTSATDSIGSLTADITANTVHGADGTTKPTWNTGDLFDPDVQLDGSTGYLATSGSAPAVTTSASFTISAWANPTALGGTVASQKGTNASGFELYLNTAGQWSFCMAQADTTTTGYDCAIAASAASLGTWYHLTATYDQGSTVMKLFVNDIFVGTADHTAVTGFANTFALGRRWNAGAATGYLTGQLAAIQTWSGTALAPTQPYSPASYHQAVTPARILDTRTTNVTLSNTAATTPVAAFSITTLQISGDTVTPTASGAPTTIPTSVTAVAIDITETSPTEPGTIVAYANGTQIPITSSTNFTAGKTVTGYQIVPVGLDGKIAMQNNSTGTTHLIADITGYYTSDATLTGDQTYTPLTTYRALDTAASTTNTSLTTTGTVANGTTFTLQITGTDSIPTAATAVAINLTAFGETSSGFIEAYQTGTTQPVLTSMSYGTADIASMAADVSIGSTGKISIYNTGAATNIIGDISGYYTNTTTGQKYHAVNPTRLVDTRTGIGGTTGAITADGTYTITQATTQQITTATTPTLVTMLTATAQTAPGNLIAYPYGTTRPGTSNLNWSGTLNVANLALTPTSTNSQITLYNESTGTTHIVIDSSGYFATS